MDLPPQDNNRNAFGDVSGGTVSTGANGSGDTGIGRIGDESVGIGAQGTGDNANTGMQILNHNGDINFNQGDQKGCVSGCCCHGKKRCMEGTHAGSDAKKSAPGGAELAGQSTHHPQMESGCPAVLIGTVGSSENGAAAPGERISARQPTEVTFTTTTTASVSFPK